MIYRKNKNFLKAALTFAFFSLFIVSVQAERSTTASNAVVTGGDPADFNLQLINSQGENVSLSAFKGKTIFMNFWAVWCPPCRAEMPSINNLYNKVKDDDVVFIMLSFDDSFDKAKKYVSDKGFDFDVYQLKGALPDQYYSQGIPTTFVISPKGEIALKHVGMAEYDSPEFIGFLHGLK